MDAAARRQLFVEMASREGGTTAQEVHEAARRKGDTCTEEAYHNLGRRLARSGRLEADKSSTSARTRFIAKPDPDGAWLDEDFLQTIIDPEHPVESLAVTREARRQLRLISPEAWSAAAALLATTNAPEAAFQAISSYSDELVDSLDELAGLTAEQVLHKRTDLERARRRCEGLIEMLTKMCRDGLGLSRDAVHIPFKPDHGVRDLASWNGQFVNRDLLRDEIGRRVEDVSLLTLVPVPTADPTMVVAGVDGSTKSGLLSIDGTAGDFAFGPPPQVNLNTAAALLNRWLRRGDHHLPLFLRLPSAPEDIQRRDNRYTIMSPMFFPDLSEGKYLHAAINAMDVLECRVSRAALDRWEVPRQGVEVAQADIVIRDGTIVPNDRDPSHYAELSSYGRIVREMIDLSWDMARKCQADDQTVAGSVKHSPVRVIAPIINYVLAQAAGTPRSDLRAWPIEELNALPDQALLTRLLTHAPRSSDHWIRSAIVTRPFHATAPAWSRYYTRHRSPGQEVRDRIKHAQDTAPEARTSDQHGWAEMRPTDSYVQMLDNVWYASFYMAPRTGLGRGQALPRLELLIPAPVVERGDFPPVVSRHLNRLLVALRETGFAVSQDHDLLSRAGTVDFVPVVLQRAHEIVNAFAREMVARAGEYMDRLLSAEIRDRRRGRLSVRPWTPAELQNWKNRLNAAREAERVLPLLD